MNSSQPFHCPLLLFVLQINQPILQLKVTNFLIHFLFLSSFPVSDCPERLPPLQCSPGLFIKGRVKPSLEGVTITVTLLQQDTQELLQVITDKKGRYKAGPIHASTEHTVVSITHSPQHWCDALRYYDLCVPTHLM